MVASLSVPHHRLSTAMAQEPTPPAKGAIRKDQPASSLTPEVRLRLQRLKTRKARAAYDVARLNREIAGIAVEEYTLGTYREELAAVEGEVKDAEADLARARERFDRAKRMFEKGGLEAARAILEATQEVEEFRLKIAEYSLEQAQSKRKVLKRYTYERTIKELESEVKKAREVESDREAEWRREADRLAELERRLHRT